MFVRAPWLLFQLELRVIKVYARKKSYPDASLSYCLVHAWFSKLEGVKKATVIERCYCMWYCLPRTLDTNIFRSEAGFSCVNRGAIWDVQDIWDSFAGLMDMTQDLQEIHVVWEQQWEATWSISKGMNTQNKQHLWGTQRLLCLLLLIHLPWSL